ncbi:hypothetical protein [Burkholderia stagnalis]|uniref:hypothetical protein n=1 Tax=Burkholderia stagnalis TaxID=1503054 RepID=UPI000F7FDD39|nr:hypothetical protein [Burkholderia stagnalis]
MRHDQRHRASTGKMQSADVGLYDDLHLALLRKAFFVVYQPIVDLASNVVVSLCSGMPPAGT